MRIFEVRVRPVEELRAEFLAAAKLAHTGKPFPGDQGVFFESYETARALFTDKRLELLRLIKKHAPTSINQLAKIAGRDFKNVHTDIVHFAYLDIVDIPRGKRVGEPLKVLYDRIDLHAEV